MIVIKENLFSDVQHGIVDGAVQFTLEASFLMSPGEPFF
jgi:hypothetical protein